MKLPSRSQKREGRSYLEKKAHRIAWAIKKNKSLAEVAGKKIKIPYK